MQIIIQIDVIIIGVYGFGAYYNVNNENIKPRCLAFIQHTRILKSAMKTGFENLNVLIAINPVTISHKILINISFNGDSFVIIKFIRD